MWCASGAAELTVMPQGSSSKTAAAASACRRLAPYAGQLKGAQQLELSQRIGRTNLTELNLAHRLIPCQVRGSKLSTKQAGCLAVARGSSMYTGRKD